MSPKRFEKVDYINEPLPLKNKAYLNVIFEGFDSRSIFLVMYKIVQNPQPNHQKFIYENQFVKHEFENRYSFINSKNKNELIQKKQKLEEELSEKREHTSCMSVPGNFDLEDNYPKYENQNAYFGAEVNLKCKQIIRLDKQAFYESVVEQLLIYELTYYESQINLYNKGLDDITKEIICLTHFLNYKESMKQINLLKAKLYKTLSESIKHKNFSHMEELQKFKLLK